MKIWELCNKVKGTNVDKKTIENWAYMNRICPLMFDVGLEIDVETEEDAEWYLEFGNITRTETLSLPTWGMFIQLGIPFEFTSKTGEYFYLEICDIAGTDKIIIYNKIGFISNVFSAPVTKENYLEACKIARKLFLGEE